MNNIRPPQDIMAQRKIYRYLYDLYDFVLVDKQSAMAKKRVEDLSLNGKTAYLVKQ